MKNECLGAAIEELARVGIRCPEIVHGAKHPQLRWTNPRGELRMLSVSGTPSDLRSVENTRRDIKRILRNDGMIDQPQPKAPPLQQPSKLEQIERRLARIEQRLGLA